ncbi:MAG: radical SAM family heme chaperone HemW [Proteobacteria bacterium]|nr:radical SAM family heme chaperone HemW [Pseudomonadota bacterium]
MLNEEKIVPCTGLYIHIPFCGNKCPYCDFNSTVEAHIPEVRYVDVIIREMDYYIKGGGFARPLDTIYIGGGTPSILSPKEVSRLFAHIKESFEWTPEIEATIEVNPSSIDMAKLEAYLASGINRLSLGVQSFNDTELKALGRTHSAKEAKAAFFMARKAGFKSIGIDLIYAIPGQSVDSFRENLVEAIELKPEHISVYGLTLEEGTPMKEAVESGEVELVSEEVEAECYELLVESLTKAGYVHYEISNFALSGFESRHNLRYWETHDYLGLGAGAHSCLAGTADGESLTKRWWNVKEVEGYMGLVEEEGQALAGVEALTHDEERIEALYLGLRLLKGLNIKAFETKFNISPTALLDNKAISGGLVVIDDAEGGEPRLRLTSRGLLFSNEIF